MPDHHQLVDQIRAFVQSSDQTRNALLESLASSYAEACVEVNQRMGRCHRLLQQGLRSEAIQLADSEPNLLDSLAALDFPERADWDELMQIYNLAAAPEAFRRAGAVLERSLCPGRPASGPAAHASTAGAPACTDQVPDRRDAQAGCAGREQPDLDRRLADLRESPVPRGPGGGGARPCKAAICRDHQPDCWRRSNSSHGSSRRRRRCLKHSGKPMRSSGDSRLWPCSTIWMLVSTMPSPPATRFGAGWHARIGSL